MVVLSCGEDDIALNLIYDGIDLNAADESWMTARHLEAVYGRCEVARCLLMAGANLNAVDKDGKTVLMGAVSEVIPFVKQLFVCL